MGVKGLSLEEEEAGAGAKLIQHGPLGATYHCRHLIFTLPVARVTVHATPNLSQSDLSSLFSASCGIGKNCLSQRIIGGSKSCVGQFPWMVSSAYGLFWQ